jgi:hypothetical protein
MAGQKAAPEFGSAYLLPYMDSGHKIAQMGLCFIQDRVCVRRMCGPQTLLLCHLPPRFWYRATTGRAGN